MNWTRQDTYTFLIGLGTAVAFVVGEAFIRAQEMASDPEKWAIGLGTGVMAAAGRYLVTELTQRGFGPKKRKDTRDGKPRRNRPRPAPP